MTSAAIRNCRSCGKPIIGRSPSSKSCGPVCAKSARLTYMRDYIKTYREDPKNREYHRQWMSRKREQFEYKERERAQQRQYYHGRVA